MSLDPTERKRARIPIIVIGASAGGVSALCSLLNTLPPGLPAAYYIVLHTGKESVLDQVLTRCDSHKVSFAADGEIIERGRIHIAPPGVHLILTVNAVKLSHAPKDRHWRPSVDNLFVSAAENHGPDVIGIVLTGMLDDGARGLRQIKDAGGVTIIQDPADAKYPSMPENALRIHEPDFCIPLKRIPALIKRLCLKMTKRG